MKPALFCIIVLVALLLSVLATGSTVAGTMTPATDPTPPAAARVLQRPAPAAVAAATAGPQASPQTLLPAAVSDNAVVEFLTVIFQMALLIFIIASMLAMGMSLTIPMILLPLRNVRLVLLALLANFVLVPLLAFVIKSIIPLEQPLQIGLIVLGTAAGAPFLPKLVQGAKGNVAFGVGLMVLFMVVTVIYVPVVLPLLLPGVSVHPWDIAKSLIVLMMIPLAIGLLIKSHSPGVAAEYQPLMGKTSSIALIVLLVASLGMNVSNIIDMIGSGGFLALLLFIAGCLAIGLLLGGRDPAIRSAMGLGTAQRNVSASILVSAQNFSGTATLPFVLVAGLVLLLVLLPAARWIGARSESAEPAAPAQAGRSQELM